MFFYDLFRVCLFWVKITSGNGGVWLVRKIEFSGNWFPLIEKKWLWLRKTFYIHFHFKVFPERERERASAREEEDRAPVQSDDRRRTPSSSPHRSRELQSDDCDPSARCFARSRSRLREIAPSIAVVRLELAKHRAVEPIRASIVDDFFSGFVFSFFFSKHQKIFFRKFFEMQPNTWKHFPFRKIAFPKNGIFSGNAFTRTKHSLILDFFFPQCFFKTFN